MKKILLVLVVLLVSLSSVSYASYYGDDVNEPSEGDANESEDSSANGSEDDSIYEGDWEGDSGDDYNEIPERNEDNGSKPVTGGKYTNEFGGELELEKYLHWIRLRAGNVSVNTSLNLTQEMIKKKIRLHAMMSNGRNAEIKIMPDTASETALARLRLKVCKEDEGCTIELKEVGDGVDRKLAYELRAKKAARILGMFKTRMQVQAQVDAENGELIKEHKPWWAFIASEKAEE